MEYKYKSGESHPHEFTFDKGYEIRAIRAAFREVIRNRAARGNSNSSQPLDARLALYSRNANILVQSMSKPEYMTDVLLEFADNTDNAIDRIPEETKKAAFLSNEIPLRLIIGEEARLLAEEMIKAVAQAEMERDPEHYGNLSDDEKIQRFADSIPDAIPEDD